LLQHGQDGAGQERPGDLRGAVGLFHDGPVRRGQHREEPGAAAAPAEDVRDGRPQAGVEQQSRVQQRGLATLLPDVAGDGGVIGVGRAAFQVNDGKARRLGAGAQQHRYPGGAARPAEPHADEVVLAGWPLLRRPV
jgi:hypothetical protein